MLMHRVSTGRGIRRLYAYTTERQDRVAWSSTAGGAPAVDPEVVIRMMQSATADATINKQLTGHGPAGRKLKAAYGHYLVSFERGLEPSRAEMEAAADKLLEALGATDHLAVLVAHNDTNNPHVHVLVGRVHPETGIALGLQKDKQRLSVASEEWERNHQGGVVHKLRTERREAREVFRARLEEKRGQWVFDPGLTTRERRREERKLLARAVAEVKAELRETAPYPRHPHEIQRTPTAERQRGPLAVRKRRAARTAAGDALWSTIYEVERRDLRGISDPVRRAELAIVHADRRAQASRLERQALQTPDVDVDDHVDMPAPAAALAHRSPPEAPQVDRGVEMPAPAPMPAFPPARAAHQVDHEGEVPAPAPMPAFPPARAAHQVDHEGEVPAPAPMPAFPPARAAHQVDDPIDPPAEKREQERQQQERELLDRRRRSLLERAATDRHLAPVLDQLIEGPERGPEWGPPNTARRLDFAERIAGQWLARSDPANSSSFVRQIFVAIRKSIGLVPEDPQAEEAWKVVRDLNREKYYPEPRRPNDDIVSGWKSADSLAWQIENPRDRRQVAAALRAHGLDGDLAAEALERAGPGDETKPRKSKWLKNNLIEKTIAGVAKAVRIGHRSMRREAGIDPPDEHRQPSSSLWVPQGGGFVPDDPAPPSAPASAAPTPPEPPADMPAPAAALAHRSPPEAPQVDRGVEMPAPAPMPAFPPARAAHQVDHEGEQERELLDRRRRSLLERAATDRHLAPVLDQLIEGPERGPEWGPPNTARRLDFAERIAGQWLARSDPANSSSFVRQIFVAIRKSIGLVPEDPQAEEAWKVVRDLNREKYYPEPRRPNDDIVSGWKSADSLAWKIENPRDRRQVAAALRAHGLDGDLAAEALERAGRGDETKPRKSKWLKNNLIEETIAGVAKAVRIGHRSMRREAGIDPPDEHRQPSSSLWVWPQGGGFVPDDPAPPSAPASAAPTPPEPPADAPLVPAARRQPAEAPAEHTTERPGKRPTADEEPAAPDLPPLLPGGGPDARPPAERPPAPGGQNHQPQNRGWDR